MTLPLHYRQTGRTRERPSQVRCRSRCVASGVSNPADDTSARTGCEAVGARRSRRDGREANTSAVRPPADSAEQLVVRRQSRAGAGETFTDSAAFGYLTGEAAIYMTRSWLLRGVQSSHNFWFCNMSRVYWKSHRDDQGEGDTGDQSKIRILGSSLLLASILLTASSSDWGYSLGMRIAEWFGTQSNWRATHRYEDEGDHDK
jgi:hypothetical protein